MRLFTPATLDAVCRRLRETPIVWVSSDHPGSLRKQVTTYTGLLLRRIAMPSEEHSVSLKQQEEPFLATFELVGFGVAHLSLDGRFTMVSRRLCDIVGHPRNELLAKALPDIVDPEDSASQLIPQDLLTGEAATAAVQRRVIRKDSRTVWIRAVMAAVCDEETRAPRYLFAVVEDVTEREEARRALQRQVGFDDLMTTILTRFTTCAAAEVDESVIEALRRLAEFVGVDHAHVIIFSRDRTSWSATHEWTGAGVKPQLETYKDIPFGTFPWSEQRLLAGETIRLNSYEEHPPEAREELNTPDRLAGSHSLLLVPILGAAGVIAGCVGLDMHARPFVWSDLDVARCKMAGDAIATVLERKRVERARWEIAGRLINAQEAERARIARELHDDIGQSLALLGVQLQRSSPAPSGKPEATRVDVTELRDRVKEIGSKVSRLSHQLHSSDLDYLGLAVAVKSLCREFSDQFHIAVECCCTGVPEELDGKIALGCLRVIQEALHNVAKHSHATQVRVEVIGAAGNLSLAVVDNGDGFDASQSGAGPGLGLTSMRERMHLVGGDFMISSSPGNGTHIKARAPLAAVEQETGRAAHGVDE
jgi:PAS domain S-box-containing protein